MSRRHHAFLRRSSAVADALRQSIQGRTGLQVRGLAVEQVAGRFRISGRVSSFYAQQLVLSACNVVLGDECPHCLDCQIEVAP